MVVGLYPMVRGMMVPGAQPAATFEAFAYWSSGPDECVGVSTAQAYTECFTSAVVAVLKPVYMPGPLCVDSLERVQCKFAECTGIGGMAMTVD